MTIQQEKKMSRTITEEIGRGPIQVLTIDHCDIATDEDRASIDTSDPNKTEGIDGRSERIEPNPKGSNAPLGVLVAIIDDGPTIAFKIALGESLERWVKKTGKASPAANDNEARKERYHLKEMFERGELGIGQPENALHWFDAE